MHAFDWTMPHNSLVRFLITGINGQDGSLLGELLADSGNELVGISTISAIKSSLPCDYKVFSIDLSREDVAFEFLNSYKPERIIHLAAVHASSFEMKNFDQSTHDAMWSCHVNTTRNLLEWLRTSEMSKLVVALSSQMYGAGSDNFIISEKTPLSPINEYGRTKSEAFRLIQEYRIKYEIFGTGAILFNHTSIKSKSNFLFPELADQICNVFLGLKREIIIRNFDALIDICSAYEVCKGLLDMLELPDPQDFVFSSCKLIKVRVIVLEVLEKLGIDHPVTLTSSDSHFNENRLVGDSSQANKVLGWRARKSATEILYDMSINRIQQKKPRFLEI
jgi:GDP-D-mannose dehydratase